MQDRFANDKRRKTDRVGETGISNDGCLMKIVVYTNANDIIVEFQDEYKYQKRTNYKAFKKGNVKNWGKHIGEKNINRYGLPMKIVRYDRSDDIVIEFDDGETVHTTYTNFKNGNVRHPKNNFINSKHTDRLFEKNINNQGCLMEIVKYNTYHDIEVKFLDQYQYEQRTSYYHFKKGDIKNPYYPSVFGIGIIGSKYPTEVNNKPTKEFSTWHDMMKRCYSDALHEKRPTYIGCYVCEEWILYENFYEWLINQENYEKWAKEKLSALDKDILIKHNKVYSPSTCSLVPLNINSLFDRNESKRGDLPIGVNYHIATKKYIAQCCYLNQNIYLGVYDKPDEAFKAYKKYKEKVIKKIAEEAFSNHLISEKCYKAMINYIVEEDD